MLTLRLLPLNRRRRLFFTKSILVKQRLKVVIRIQLAELEVDLRHLCFLFTLNLVNTQELLFTVLQILVEKA